MSASRRKARRRARHKARRAGIWAEAAAAWRLRILGYRIEGRNLRTPLGEIDLIARRGTVLAIVEVKYRPVATDVGAVVTRAQQQRLVNAARWLISGRPAFAALTVRFDVVLVRPWRIPLHVQSAWREDW